MEGVFLFSKPRSKKRTRQTDDSLEEVDQDRGTDEGVVIDIIYYNKLPVQWNLVNMDTKGT